MRHILVIDDDPAICDVLQIGLEMDGACRVTQATSAAGAMAAVLRDPPDVAIIDAILPKISGLALALDLVEIHIPVLITTGAPEQQRQLDTAGCRFLAKPFTFARLEEEVEALLADSARRRAQLATALHELLDARHELAGTMIQTARFLEHARSRQLEDRVGGLRPREHQAVFDTILDEAITTTVADMGTLQLARRDTGALHIVTSRGFRARYLTFFNVVRPGGSSSCAAALMTRERVIVPDIEQSVIFAGKPSGEILREAGARSVLSAPILGRGDRLLGVISVHRRSVWVPSEAELQRLDALVARAAREIEEQ